MAERTLATMNIEEFLAWQLDQDERYELVDGIPLQMMAGASEVHDRIVTNIIIALGIQLRGSPCRPATADVAVRTSIRVLRRPDVTVTCGDARADSFEAANPRLVVEVLSPSNSGLAWQRKLEEYRRHEGIAYILLVDSRVVSTTLLTRSGAGWEPTDYDRIADVIALPAIDCRLAMADVYESLALPEPQPARLD